MADTETAVVVATDVARPGTTEPEPRIGSKSSYLTESTAVVEDTDSVQGSKRNVSKSRKASKPESNEDNTPVSPQLDAKTVLKKQLEKSQKDRQQEADDENGSDSDVNEILHKPLFNYVIERADRLSTKNLYDIYSRKLDTEDKKRPVGSKGGKAPRIVRGFADYVRTLEERIATLEANSEVKGPMNKTTPDNVVSATGDPSMRTAFYKFCDGQTFEFIDLINNDAWKEKGTFTSEVDERHFLRVLYQGSSTPSSPTESLDPGPDIEVLALQLYSAPVATFLEKLAQHQVHKDHLVRLTKPFRLLIQNADTIRDHLKRLQEHYSVSTVNVVPPTIETSDTINGEVLDGNPLPESESEPQESTVETKQQPYDTPDAMQHFEELVRFLDKHLGEQLRTYNELRSAKVTKVAFENLWMLFKIHDKVYSPSQKGSQFLFSYASGPKDADMLTTRRDVSQAYQVIATTGGLPLFGKLTPRKEEDADDILLKLTKAGIIEQQTPRNSQRVKDKYSPLYIYACYMSWAPSGFYLRSSPFSIRPYDGEVEVTSLEIYPINHRPQQPSGSRVKDLAERGLRFIDYTTVTHLQHQGLTLGDNQEEINGPVIIDLEQAGFEMVNHQVISSLESADPSYFWTKRVQMTVPEIAIRTCSDATCHLVSHIVDISYSHSKTQSEGALGKLDALIDDYVTDDNDPSHINSFKKALEEHGLLELLPGSVSGFALRDRKWLEFDIDLLSKVEEDDDESGWEDLILPDDHRAMVQSMVETHSAGGANPNQVRTTERSDIGLVQGKGKGCIILLHGVPGVGKTSTAECVAAYTKRPLFPITCGDIGYEPEEVEKNLQKLFKLAHKWGCVLLIDEADVFLAERDKADVKRNGLVSVFLRILEYYSGILFLTTNRVGAFDDAFRSRIHLTLYYPKLDKDQSYRVWEMNIKRISRVNKQRILDGLPKIRVHRGRILRFAELNYETLQWNGRQIQNAFQTALALAQFKVRKTPDKRPEITIEHFETIAKASIQFDTYLKEVHRGDEAKNAKTKGVRADNVKLETVRTIQLPPGTKSKRTVVVEVEEGSSESESESLSTGSSGAERKKKKKKAKSKRKGKGREGPQGDEEGDTVVGAKSKKKAKEVEDEGENVGERSRRVKAKKKVKDDETSSDSNSSDE